MDNKSTIKTVLVLMGGILTVALTMAAVIPFVNELTKVEIPTAAAPMATQVPSPEAPEELLVTAVYQVEEEVKILTRQILFAYACVAPFKVLNMIAGGGIIRSGGKTKYVMVIDMIGTWGFGVPLGLLSAFVFQLSIPWVYFILSLEECVRFGISVVVLKRKRWMKRWEEVSASKICLASCGVHLVRE
mgnify:CR=1 FL=1